jgi:hypothetical protein
MINFEGKLEGIENIGSIASVEINIKGGGEKTFFGDRRMIESSIGERKKGTKVIIHFKEEWDWTIEFPDE